jgi:hypothetical protein
MMSETTRKTEREDGRGWTRAYLERRGTGRERFIDRLSRARLLHLRRHEVVCNWLALLVVLGCWGVAAQLDDTTATSAAVVALEAANHPHGTAPS